VERRKEDLDYYHHFMKGKKLLKEIEGVE